MEDNHEGKTQQYGEESQIKGYVASPSLRLIGDSNACGFSVHSGTSPKSDYMDVIKTLSVVLWTNIFG